MIGLTSYGLHIPRYRLDLETLKNAWGNISGKGERSVINYDEDSLTMAAQAVMDCKEDLSPNERIGGLYYCSTTSPYKEKLASTIIADVADLESEIDTADFANSLRAGSAALKVALDSIKSKRISSSIIVTSDIRLPEPGSPLEPVLGNGAGALSVGEANLIAIIEGFYYISKNFTELWRLERDQYVKTGDSKFTQIHGLMDIGKQAVRGILNKFQLNPENFSAIVLPSLDKNTHIQFAKATGFNVSKQLSSTIFDTIGNTGTAHSFLMLISALENSEPGDRILFINYGDGADVFILKVTEEIRKIKSKMKFKRSLEYKRKLSNYTKYLLFRDILKKNPEPEPFSSLILQWREQKQNLSLYGTKCLECSTIYYPMRRICPYCGSRDKYEQVRMNRKGKVHTFNRDRLFACPDPPLMMAVVDLDDGGRFYGQMTDCDEEEIDIGLPVELVLRKFHEAKGFVNYFWKARPLLIKN